MDKDGQDRGGQGPGEQDASVPVAGAKPKRARTTWRRRRNEAGLIEVMAWVREVDLVRAIELLEPPVRPALAPLLVSPLTPLPGEPA